MSIENNVQIVKDFFAAMGRGDKQGLLASSAEDIEWIIPGQDWPLAGTHRGHAGLADLLQKASEMLEISYPDPPEFIAQGDRVLVVGFATGRIRATNRTFEDHWVFAITVRNGKLTKRPGVYRHASTGAGLRDCREPQALTQGHRHHTVRFVRSVNTLNSGNAF
jgi:ketosteroid isomerase-like protein